MNVYEINQYKGSKTIKYPESILTYNDINRIISIIDYCVYPNEKPWSNNLYHGPYRGYDSISFHIHYTRFQGAKAKSLFDALDAINMSDKVLNGSIYGYKCNVETTGDSGTIKIYIYRVSMEKIVERKAKDIKVGDIIIRNGKDRVVMKIEPYRSYLVRSESGKPDRFIITYDNGRQDDLYQSTTVKSKTLRR